jgi:enoyl-CoA hydratase
MGYENVIVETTGALGRITVNRPQALNALNARTIEELTDAVTALSDDPAVRVIVLTGAGDKAFVAGADIKSMVELPAEQAAAFSALGHRLGDAIARSPKILIAAVNGFALGGGCELALACDFIYASDRAKFGQPEVSLGVIPGFGGTTRLPRRIGMAQAIELATTGATLDAAEALRIGLVNRVVPHAELAAAVQATVDAIAKKGPLAVASVKRSVRAAAEMPLAEHNKLEVELFGACFATEDQREGMRAFIEKRPAHFPGR